MKKDQKNQGQNKQKSVRKVDRKGDTIKKKKEICYGFFDPSFRRHASRINIWDGKIGGLDSELENRPMYDSDIDFLRQAVKDTIRVKPVNKTGLLTKKQELAEKQAPADYDLLRLSINLGCRNILRNLLRYYRDVDLNSSENYGSYGVTPLMTAFRRGDIDLVTLLMESGATLTEMDSVLFHAVEGDSEGYSIRYLLKNYLDAVLSLLRDYPQININEQIFTRSEGSTVLSWVAESGSLGSEEKEIPWVKSRPESQFLIKCGGIFEHSEENHQKFSHDSANNDLWRFAFLL